MTDTKSGKAIGQEYLGRIQAYLNRTESLPVLGDGSLNMSAIANGANIPRQSLYKNPSIRNLLDDAKSKSSVPTQDTTPKEQATTSIEPRWESKQTKLLERRVNQLEQQNAALVAENAELRRQLKSLRLQLGREDMTIETGRRIPTPPTNHG